MYNHRINVKALGYKAAQVIPILRLDINFLIPVTVFVNDALAIYGEKQAPKDLQDLLTSVYVYTVQTLSRAYKLYKSLYILPII